MSEASYFDLLTCPHCHVLHCLEVRTASPESGEKWKAALKETRPLKEEIVCKECGRAYPYTEDGIPILWSDTLCDTFLTINDDIEESEPAERDVKAANILVYDATVATYHSSHVHAEGLERSRLLNAVNLQMDRPDGWHIDVGCGGGNVLEALQPTYADRQIGIDVSLVALRIVKGQGYHAVLGDAERLPIASASVSLVTASSVLHHLWMPDRLIQEASRVLQRKGLFITDFDPNQDAARWGKAAQLLFDLRLPVYRLLRRVQPKRFGHGSQLIQKWNKVAEFHNKPGLGFAPSDLSGRLEEAGMDVRLLLRHTTRASGITETKFVRPTPRALVSQTLSGRNPFLRKNADTLLTVSQKR